MDAPLLQSLPPQIADDCRVLVLGSMPGAASLGAGRYYAHPRNRFWLVLGHLAGFDPRLEYAQRIAALQAAGVGLWDVIGRCQRQGSLDSAIRDVELNPLAGRILQLDALQAIALNGETATRQFVRAVRDDPVLAAAVAGKRVHTLPSTSPANAVYGLPRLHEHWAVLRVHVG